MLQECSRPGQTGTTGTTPPQAMYGAKTTVNVTLEKLKEDSFNVPEGFDFESVLNFEVTETNEQTKQLWNCSDPIPVTLPEMLAEKEGFNFLQISIDPFEEEPSCGEGVFFWFEGKDDAKWTLATEKAVFMGPQIEKNTILVQNASSADVTVSFKSIKTKGWPTNPAIKYAKSIGSASGGK